MVKDAVIINKKDGNTLWQDAIVKEMENMKVTFQAIPNGEKVLNGYQCVNRHMVFDIQMEDFHREAHQMVRGHVTHTPDSITYSNVVTRETVCIALTVTALHDLEVKATDILNAYVMAPNRE